MRFWQFRTNSYRTGIWQLLFTFYFLLLTSIIACGRRGDPVAVMPYKEVAVVKDLNATVKDEGIHLTWGMPEGEKFPYKALKGFAIFRAELPENTTLEECDCKFTSLDFVALEQKEKVFEYIDKKTVKTQTYVYKVVVMDENNRMGRDSNIVLVKGAEKKPERVVIAPEAPAGLMAVYTYKSVVLTWSEVKGQGVKLYRIYRSEGQEFYPVGETVTTAYTDRTVEISKKYYYRVTGVGDVEGSPSETIEVSTKDYKQ